MKDWIQAAVSQWEQEGLKLNSKASISDIDRAEGLLNFKFPEDFRALYSVVNGFDNYEWRENMFSLWSLERIVQEFNESSDQEVIGFCDYLIFSHIITFERNNIGIFKNYIKVEYGKSEIIAQTFQEAIGLINCDSELIY